MNRVFSTIWNHSLGAWVVASEHASRQGKPGSSKSCALTTLGLVLISPGYALAANLPTNGQVILGAGTIATPNANQMVINQNSDKLAINWQSFDIGAGNKVQFKQPGSDSVALNRVLGNDGSKIMGQLDANGRVFLVNPNGVLFGQGAQVNVGGLVASTLDISNEDFAAGNYRFKGDGNNAAITNQGQIKASDGGAIALLGGTVSNQGTLIANQGTVALAAGNAVTLDFAGDGLLNVQVDEATLDALVENRQLIKADGGQVLLTADAGEALLKTVVNNTGVIEARTLGEKDGKIVLLGGFDGGTTQVAGTLDASAPNGGNGGFIETSGAHVKIADSAKITTKAKDGATGTWLVDPNDFTIAASGGDITGAAVSQNLLATNVELQTATMGTAGGSGDIHVNDSITWSTNSLTLTAERDININANLNASGTAKLALQYGQGAVAAGNAADYYINKGAKVNLPAGQSFQTKLGSDGAVKNYTVITSLGSEGSTSAADLQGINGGLAGNYVLGADIDASATASWESGAGFKPIGGYTTVFTGALDGLGHTISGLTINRSNSNYVGLIFTNQGELRNMGLLGGSVTGANYVGGLAGYTGNGSVISNVYATGAVTGYSIVGGLVGYNGTGNVISNAYATGSVIGGTSVGGLVGSNHGGISNAYATGAVSGSGYYVGGLVGFNSTVGVISNAYATGAVSGSGSYFGGLLGYNYGGKVSNAYATGAVSGSGYYVGGLVGFNDNGSVISNAYASGSVTGANSVGGLLGYNDRGTISNSYWTTDTTGQVVGAGGGSAFGATGLTVRELISNLPTGFDSALWGNGNNQTTPYLLGLAGNQVFNLNDLPDTISSTNRPNLYTTILTLDQLQAINSGLSGRYVLGNDIDASATAGWESGAGFKPIGDYTTVFTGALDGLGHAISGLTINRSNSNNVGLFGANQGELRNIGLLGGSVTGFGNVGGLAGYTGSASVISNVYASGAVSGSSSVGGLVGINHSSISNSYATGAVSGSSNYVGGLAGSNNGDISNAYATGVVTGTNFVGGLVGINYGDISNAYATGAVSGSGSYFGGLLGYNDRGTISNSYWTTDTTGQVVGAGGGSAFGATGLTVRELISNLPTGFDSALWGNGNNQTTPYLLGLAGNQVFNLNDLPDTISSTNRPNLYTTILTLDQLQAINSGLSGRYVLGNDIDASATAGWNAGLGFKPIGDTTTPFTGALDGLGHAISGLTINRSNSNYVGLFGFVLGGQLRNIGLLGGSVTGFSNVSGLVGYNDFGSVISNAYATGAVTGTYYVGGLIGFNNYGSVSNAYATGAVSGSAHYVGGLIGSNNNGSVINAYATGAVTGYSAVGGLVGYNSNGSVISNVYATGAVTGTYYVGGLLGYNNGTISNSFYATTDSIGANINNAGLTSGNYIGNSFGTGKTWADLTQLSTFAGWGTDIDAAGGTGSVWRIYDGSTTPLLRSFLQAVTVTSTSPTKIYDGLASGSFGYSTDLAGAILEGSAAYFTQSANAGTYSTTNGDLSLGGLYSGQQGYDISYDPTSLTINKAAATVTANSNSTTYNGQQQSASGFTVNGLVNGETASVLSGVTTTGVTGTNVGTYTLTTSGTDGNYDLTFVDGALTINKAAATVTANSNSTTYNGQQQNTSGFTVNGLVNGETASVLSGITTTGGSGTNAGTYILKASGADGNYDLTFVDGQLTINKANATVTANSNSTIYTGQQQSASGFTASGLVNGETATVLTGVKVSGSGTNAGTYTLTASGTDGNYDLTFVDGQLTINKAAATVTANSNSTTYNGQQQNTSGFTVNGLVNGETASVLSGIRTTGGSGTNAGTYILKASGADGNYDLTFVDGQLTINKAAATVTANSNSTTYNGQQQGSSGFTASGLVNGETATVLTGVKVSGSGTNAGTYTLTASGADGNYDLIFVDGQLTINKAKLSVSANSASKTADGNAFFGGNGVNYSGFVTNEDASVLGGQLVYGGSSQGAVGAGVYELNVSGLTANNYSLDYIASTLQVAAQPVPPAPPAPPSVELPSLPAVQYLSALSSAQNTDQSQADQAPVSDAALYRVVDSGIRLPEGI